MKHWLTLHWLEGSYTFLYLLSALFWLVSALQPITRMRRGEPRTNTTLWQLIEQLRVMAWFNACAALAMFAAIVLQVIWFWSG